jgi:hypothetical protein
MELRCYSALSEVASVSVAFLPMRVGGSLRRRYDKYLLLHALQGLWVCVIEVAVLCICIASYTYNVEFFVYAALVYIHRLLIRRIACLTQ